MLQVYEARPWAMNILVVSWGQRFQGLNRTKLVLKEEFLPAALTEEFLPAALAKQSQQKSFFSLQSLIIQS